MPVSFLDGLSSAARAVFPYVRRGVRTGESIAKIGTAARAEGLRIANATLSEMVRRERSIRDYIGNLKFLGPDRLPNPARLPEALSKLQRKYAIEVLLKGIHSETGKKVEIFATISTDRLLSQSRIADIAAELAQQKGGRYGFELTEHSVESYLRAGPEGFV